MSRRCYSPVALIFTPILLLLTQVCTAEEIEASNLSNVEKYNEYYDLDDEHSGGHGHASRPDDHIPAAITGGHVHKQGEVMFEYKFMTMQMDGMRTGTRSLSSTQFFNETTFNVMPTNMDMDMHMIHAMYGWTDDLTLYSMVMFKSLTMDHVTRAGGRFRTHNDGLDDLLFGGLWRVYEGCNDELILNLGFSVPTGNIGNRIPTNAGVPPAGAEFPYPMRLGSGTFDLRPGVTYIRRSCCASAGVQLQTDLPLGKNHSGYAEGSEFRLSTWYSRIVHEKVSASFRVEALFKENFRGADPQLAGQVNVVPTARTDMRGGEIVNFAYGLNFGPWCHHRFGIEIGHPVYQRLRGYQLETDLFLAASWSRAW